MIITLLIIRGVYEKVNESPRPESNVRFMKQTKTLQLPKEQRKAGLVHITYLSLCAFADALMLGLWTHKRVNK